MDDKIKWILESTIAPLERTIKRFWILIILLILICLGTNIGWWIYESSFEDITVTQENEDGYNNYIGNMGDIHNHEQ